MTDDGDSPIELAITKVVERPVGWIFYFNSKRYVETGNTTDALVGNAPFLVDRQKKCIVTLGTAYPVERYVEEYERTGRISHEYGDTQ